MPNSFRRDYPVTWSILLFVLGCKDKNSKIQNEIFWREHGALWECDPRWNTEIMNANVLSESSKAFIGARRHYRDKTTATHSYPHPREIPLSPSCPHLLTVTPFCSIPTGWEADVSVWSWIYPDPWSGYCYLRPPETSCQEQTARSAPGRRQRSQAEWERERHALSRPMSWTRPHLSCCLAGRKVRGFSSLCQVLLVSLLREGGPYLRN